MFSPVRAARPAAAARAVHGWDLVDLLCPAGLSPASARRDWARRVLVYYHGEAAGAWPLLCWQGFGARGVSAWRSETAAKSPVEEAVRTDPLWPQLLRSLLQSRPALRGAESAQALLLEVAADDSAALTTALLRSGRLEALSRKRLDAPWVGALQQWLEGTDAQAAQATMAAAWVHGPGATVQAAQLFAAGLDAQASAPGQRLAAVPWPEDFARPQARPGPWAWVALATGSCLLLLALLGLHEAWQQRLAAANLAVPAPPAPRLAAADTLPASVVRRLNHPWPEVFAAAERPAVAGLAWLSLDHQAGGELRLQGLARTPEAVQRAAAALRAQPTWHAAVIARLEADDTGLAFELAAKGPSVQP